ncbi:MAG: FKBP-type peptidyl-prolyl cis-trans isomerase [Candidatus Aenigmarchaeota archaeon]|nr:FKBP-type peptidyl-prolyl cis-trans isomerase [Candidatus Aenigmarchaeota archaeon]
MIMQKGDFVKVSYVGRLETGEIFDLTDAEVAKKEGIYSPRIAYGDLPVIVGANFMIKGLDKALLNLNVGEKKEIEVSPDEGFGERDAKLVRTVPRKFFRDQNVEPRQGLIVDFGGTKGRIQSASGGRIMVDFNNPLAGRTLKYTVEVKEKTEKPEEQVRSVFEFFGVRDVEPKIDAGKLSVNIKLPGQLKERISSLIIEYVKGIEKVEFVESYEKRKDDHAGHAHDDSQEGHDHSHEGHSHDHSH